MKLAVIPNIDRDKDLNFTEKLLAFLQPYDAEVLMEEYFRGRVSRDVRFCPRETLYREADAAIAIGGDGTFLRIARAAAEHDVAILGINMGRVGYMTELEPSELDQIAKLFAGDYRVEERMMLSASVLRGGERVYEKLGLNDAVVHNGMISRILDIDLYADGTIMNAYRADGIIISTPTGSTAYSMAAGGPIVDPVMNCLSVIPICPHSLYSRAIVFPDTAKVEVVLPRLHGKDALLTVDGSEGFAVRQGDRVCIQKSEQKTKIIRVKKSSFYDTLYRKLADRGVQR
ncbi:NAD(+)/NADH kinase [Feifania hominis]|uniref:NAD kinase n=1 Tax=Feifania hominis TaxID=2763660 RepID=A0A926DBL7_9FIRM|nr:NAD(+)/NADH kinase [Feifania hominis]MBC8535553.1 NAD(+)/NADH kinase [Feifania hominis]